MTVQSRIGNWLTHPAVLGSAFILGSLLTGSQALAEHGRDYESSPARALIREATELNQSVQIARLTYPVINATERLVQEAHSFHQCVTYGDSNRYGRGRRGLCQSEYREVRFAFDHVARFLHDSAYDFPQVYRQYLYTQEALNRAAPDWSAAPPAYPFPPTHPVPMPPPSYPPVPRPLRAQGNLDGMYFDLLGDRTQILKQCHGIAARTNALWFRYVQVNGRTYQDPYGRFLHVNDACQFVAQSAF